MNTPKRYHPMLVTLHWLTVVLILGAGFLAEDESRSPLDIHIVLGAVLLAVLIVRVIVRFATKRPAWADSGHPLLNMLGELVHFGLYFMSFFILIMGGWIALRRNLFAAVLGTGAVGGRPGIIGPIHHLGWILLLMLLAVHVGAALYHQFLLRDNLFSRMWFGKSQNI